MPVGAPFSMLGKVPFSLLRKCQNNELLVKHGGVY